MWRKNTLVVLIVSSLVGVGLWLLSFGWTRVSTDRKLEQGSAVVVGRVISAAARPLSKGGQSLTLVVEYRPPNHPAITKEFDVDAAAYKAAQAGGQASVTYLPGDPHVSRVTKFAILPYQILIGLGGIMLLSGLFCLVHALTTRTKSLPSPDPA
jgi:hypothetical protein